MSPRPIAYGMKPSSQALTSSGVSGCAPVSFAVTRGVCTSWAVITGGGTSGDCVVCAAAPDRHIAPMIAAKNAVAFFMFGSPLPHVNCVNWAIGLIVLYRPIEDIMILIGKLSISLRGVRK